VNLDYTETLVQDAIGRAGALIAWFQQRIEGRLSSHES
jgi:hypothetical protein